jgi:kynureninase
MKFRDNLQFAAALDRKDPLKKFRSKFHIPLVGRKPAIYLAGNSLGLLPKSTEKFVNEELRSWAKLGVDGHFQGTRPWLDYHQYSRKPLAQLVGAQVKEVVAMNQLTINLHLMMTSFYRPSGERNIIITEAGAFSSDQYAVESQVRLHGLDPASHILELRPRENEFTLRTDDIVTEIWKHRDRVALVLLGGVQYYTGQFFEIEVITRAAHDVGAYAGFDLAHAIGNVPLALHEDQVDFAVWCSYKYLNSGPGGIAGAFVHEHHHRRTDLHRLAGWWGHRQDERFEMKKGFIPIESVEGWQVSNFPVLTGAAHLASLKLFSEAGIKPLRKKSLLLTGYLEFLLKRIDTAERFIKIITPHEPEQRGCQLSIYIRENGQRIFNEITKAGVIADWREPNVIRVAPVPLYNTFKDVYQFCDILWNALRVSDLPSVGRVKQKTSER